MNFLYYIPLKHPSSNKNIMMREDLRDKSYMNRKVNFQSGFTINKNGKVEPILFF